MSDNRYLTPSRDHLSASSTLGPGEDSVGTQATTYEDLVQALHKDSVILQWLPSEAEVDQLFDEHDGTPAPRLHTGRPGIAKLVFGTYREEDNTVAQVCVYLRSPSFSNTEPSMMFTKYTAKTKYTAMNTKHINCTSGAFVPNKFWRPFVVRSGKIHFTALRAVVKALFIRKGIRLSVPIPVTSPSFRSALILGCGMFRTYAENTKDEARNTSSEYAALDSYNRDTVGSPLSFANVVEDSSAPKPGADECASRDNLATNCGTNSIESNSMCAEHDDTLYKELPSTPKYNDSQRNHILADIILPLSASRNDRRTLTESILGKMTEKHSCISSLDTLRLEEELLETEIKRQEEAAERNRADMKEKIHAKEQEVSKIVAEIEESMHTIQEKHEGEKRRLTQVTPDLAAFWQLSREYAYDEFNAEDKTVIKRQKTDQ